MENKTGNLSINSENILPIIKKWLYSDKDIFIRELVSNACDAITKLEKLAGMGQTTIDGFNPRIDVFIDEQNKTIQITDNGLGMTEDEIVTYICQIAFSGAEDFLKQYQDKMDQNNEIIGHFGLGFYSAFMVADQVEIDSLSYKEGAQPVKWLCNGGIDYTLSPSEKNTVGTTITLYIGEDGKEFLNEYKLRSILYKYCSFMPVEIYLDSIKEAEEVKEGEEEKEIKAPEPINDTKPLWQKAAKDCTDQEYKDFYHKVFTDFNDPLFWIHLNMDYPVRLKGILYFPKLKSEMDAMEGQVKLYNNQVFVADNIKEVIPEFLLLLKGVLDCPDLPLNVSRSFLQNDGYAAKMSGYITKKVADKLKSLYKKEQETYEKFWDDIQLFIKYGCLKEEKFYDKVKDILLFKTIQGETLTLQQFQEQKEAQKDKIFYVTDEKGQSQYIKLFREQDMNAVILTAPIDTPFISFLEMQSEGCRFVRIDSDLSDTLLESEKDEALLDPLQTLFREILAKDALKIRTEKMKSKDVAALFLTSEQSRRFADMNRMFGQGMGNAFEDEDTLLLNTNHNLVQTLSAISQEEGKEELKELICKQLYDLAFLGYKEMPPKAMEEFIKRSADILEKLAQSTQ